MTTEQRRTEFHTLAHLQPGRTLAWISDPLGVTSDPLVTAVNKAALGVVALDVRLAEIIKANGDVHTAAKTEHVAAQMRYSAAAGELGAAREKHAEREDALYLPPVAKPAEVTSDVELRAWLFSLNAEARKRALDQCAKGEFLDLLIAGARFAAPEPCAPICDAGRLAGRSSSADSSVARWTFRRRGEADARQGMSRRWRYQPTPW